MSSGARRVKLALWDSNPPSEFLIQYARGALYDGRCGGRRHGHRLRGLRFRGRRRGCRRGLHVRVRLSEVLLANAGEHGHWRLLEGPSTRPRLIYSSGVVGSFGERDGGADVAEVT